MKPTIFRFFLFLLMLTLYVSLSAQSALASTPPSPTFDQWGLGLGVAVESYRSEFVKSAYITGDDKIVVLEESYKSAPSIWAVGSWTRDACGWMQGWGCWDWVKPGLFFGLKLAGENGVALEGVSVGLQWSFLQNIKIIDKNGAVSTGMKPSWNLGVGWVNHKTQTLAQGIAAGQSLPSQYDQIRYERGSENSFAIMISKNIF